MQEVILPVEGTARRTSRSTSSTLLVASTWSHKCHVTLLEAHTWSPKCHVTHPEVHPADSCHVVEVLDGVVVDLGLLPGRSSTDFRKNQ